MRRSIYERRVGPGQHLGRRMRSAAPAGLAPPRAAQRGATAGRPSSEFTHDLACGDELLEGGLATRKESVAGFGQADTARRADEEHCTDARLKGAKRLTNRR